MMKFRIAPKIAMMALLTGLSASAAFAAEDSVAFNAATAQSSTCPMLLSCPSIKTLNAFIASNPAHDPNNGLTSFSDNGITWSFNFNTVKENGSVTGFSDVILEPDNTMTISCDYSSTGGKLYVLSQDKAHFTGVTGDWKQFIPTMQIFTCNSSGGNNSRADNCTFQRSN